MSLSSESLSLLSLDSVTLTNNINIAIIATEWNEHIVHAQIEGAKHILNQFDQCTTRIYTVPGAVEIPYAAQQIQKLNQFDAIITFGAIIKGGTPHFDYVCKIIAEGIVQLNIQHDSPVIFGVLTVNSEEQAWERLGGKHGHKGAEAAIAALKMIQFKRAL